MIKIIKHIKDPNFMDMEYGILLRMHPIDFKTDI